MKKKKEIIVFLVIFGIIFSGIFFLFNPSDLPNMETMEEDIPADPQETTNRWIDPAYQLVKMEMLQRLCDRMAWTVDPLPVREGRW